MSAVRFLIMGLATAISGCGGGGMLPGTIYSNDGRVLQFEIERAHRTGAVRASDPATGETFLGSYVAIVERMSTTSSGTVVAGKVVATGFGRGSISSNTANATAYLKGDKGTMLNCEMRIEAGFPPHGLGTCQDNQSQNYRLQF
jgi:ribosomal protein L35AE/L33A